jgi:uncharacterized membrane-anchored protein
MYNREETEKEKTKEQKKHENASLALLFGGIIVFYAALSLIGGLTYPEYSMEPYTIFWLLNLLFVGILILFVGYFTLYPKREDEEKKVLFLLTAILGAVVIIIGVLGILSVIYSVIQPMFVLIIQLGCIALGIYLIYYGIKKYRFDWAAEFY